MPLNLDERSNDSVGNTKNIESVKRVVMKRLLSHAKMNNKCTNCGLVCKKMMLFNSQIVYTLVVNKGKDPQSKGDTGYMEDGTDFLDSLIGTIGIDLESASTGTQKYLTPSEARLVSIYLIFAFLLDYCILLLNWFLYLEFRDHMRMLWMSDADFLRELFPVLQTTTTSFPTDLFFVEVVAVPPPKNRAVSF